MSDAAFWMVWNPAGRAPAHKHATKELAEQEAERLARANRGQSFIVLQSVSGYAVDDVKRTTHVDRSDEQPF